MIIKQYVRFTDHSLNSGPIKHQNEDNDIVIKHNMGIETVLYTSDKKNTFDIRFLGKSFIRKLISRWGFYKFVKQQISESHDTIVMIRVNSLDILLLPLVYKMCLSGKRVILVYHTIFDLKFARVSRAFHKVCHRFCFGIAAPTREILDYYKTNQILKSYLIPNGVILDAKITNDHKVYENELLNLVFLASSYQNWHGLDSLIRTMEASEKSFVKLHVIGSIHSENRENVHFWGHREGEELSSILAKMDIGIGSFPPKNFHLKETSSLKHREYLRHGLPVFTGVYDALCDVSHVYFKVDEFKIEKIIEFALKVKGTSKGEIYSTFSHVIDRKAIIEDFVNTLKVDAKNADF